MTRTWMLWFGGSSYAAPTTDDAEEFDTIKEAREAFEARADFDPYFPCVSEDTCAHLFFADPRETSDPYPDRVLTLGPRGGVREDNA